MGGTKLLAKAMPYIIQKLIRVIPYLDIGNVQIDPVFNFIGKACFI